MLDIQETNARRAAESDATELEVEPQARSEPRIKPSAVMMSLPTDPPAQIVPEPVKIKPQEMQQPEFAISLLGESVKNRSPHSNGSTVCRMLLVSTCPST